MKIKRKVERHYNYIAKHAGWSNGSNILLLECGHEIRRKYSQGVPAFVYCKDCEDLSTGRIKYMKIGNVMQTWDEEKQLPVFTEIK